MKTSFLNALLVSLGILSLVGCADDGDSNSNTNRLTNGYIIANEGQFGKTTGTISIIKDTVVEHKVYQNRNNKSEIGQVVQQTIATNNGLVFVVNNGGKLQFTDKAFKSTGELQMANPRYGVYTNGHIWITSWGKTPRSQDNDKVYKINTSSMSIVDSITVSYGAESIAILGNFILVTSKGGHLANNKLTLIDQNTKAKTEFTAKYYASNIETDSKHFYWNASNLGKTTFNKTEYNTSIAPYYTLRLDPVAKKIDTLLTTNEPLAGQPIQINNTLYVVTSKDKTLHAIQNKTLTKVGALSKNIKVIYRTQQVDNKLFIFDAVDYTSSGKVYIYTIKNNALSLESSHTVGVNPSHVLAN